MVCGRIRRVPVAWFRLPATPRKRPRVKPYTAQPGLATNGTPRTSSVSNNETITISGRKPKTNTAAHRTSPNVPTTPLKPKKIKQFIGGTDDGSSIRPAGGVATTTATPNIPANVNLRKVKKQDIEVENDETHFVGHDRKKRTGLTNKPTVKPKRH